MRAVLQRVSAASVSIDNQLHASISQGLLVLLAVHQNDSDSDIAWMIAKILECRLFNDDNGKMNLSLQDIQGELLVVSQFTLYGDLKKGRRPNFMNSAPPEQAKRLYTHFLEELNAVYPKAKSGIFAANMQVSLVNDGPVTLILDSP